MLPQNLVRLSFDHSPSGYWNKDTPYHTVIMADNGYWSHIKLNERYFQENEAALFPTYSRPIISDPYEDLTRPCTSHSALLAKSSSYARLVPRHCRRYNRTDHAGKTLCILVASRPLGSWGLNLQYSCDLVQ